MEASFQVHLIGTFDQDVLCVPADAPADDWLAEHGPDFDQFPVKQGNETLGVLRRGHSRPGATAREAMEPLREGLVVSAHMPIAALIPGLKSTHYRLVLRGADIDGLVTHSDLLKLPVRVLTFSLLTHLEQVMADAIQAHWSGDTWLPCLSPGRQSRVRQKQTALQRKRMNPPLLELTDFGDKGDLCAHIVGTDERFAQDLHRLRDLRNQVAHAGTFLDPADGPSAVVAFADRFESALLWISDLTARGSRLKGTR